ncbi:DnaJ domain-containing protein [uncultured Desulfobacter sp.]|uniref:DnaJ domain-containing protein n=1 Tax=uncultured Desulfobacter sp. TaxID=240139 RepID=UPI002AAB3636|nr:DnaJ domain-containing protein [uncultured Desulfobacter sp.]
MTPLVKFILVLLGLAYLISPADLIPEMYLPWVGWIDDSLVMLCIYHLIRYGRLPSFLFRKGGKSSSKNKTQDPATEKPSGKASQNGSTARPNTTGPSEKQNRYTKTDTVKSPFEILGVDRNASWSDIQTAYKNKAKQYHPDKLSHLGEEFSNLANGKFLEIQQAYAKLKSLNNR